MYLIILFLMYLLLQSVPLVLLDLRSYVQDEVDKLKETYFTHVRILDPAKYGFVCRRARMLPGSPASA